MFKFATMFFMLGVLAFILGAKHWIGLSTQNGVFMFLLFYGFTLITFFGALWTERPGDHLFSFITK